MTIIKMVPNPIDPLDEYYWNDFLQEFQEPPNLQEMNNIVEHYKNRLSRVLVKVNDGDSYYLKKDSKFKLFNRIEKIPDEMIQWCSVVFDQKTGEINIKWSRMKLKKIYEDGIGNRIFTVYNDTTWRPSLNYSGRELNLWTGFRTQRRPSDWTYDKEKVLPILSFIEEIICNNNKDKYTWLISWFHHCFTKPEEKTGICPILFSPEQGTGKGTLTNFLINHVYGREIADEVAGLSKIVQQFNTVRSKKCLICADEISALKGDFHAIFDNFKNAITAPQTLIEHKNVNTSYSVDDFTNFIVSTNNLHSVKIESTDRRFMLFNVSPKRVNEHKYYKDLRTKHLTDDGARHFFEYISNLQEEELVDISYIVECETKKKIKDLSRPVTDRFFDAFKSGTWEICAGHTHLIADVDTTCWKFSRPNLYKIFTEWCKETGEPTVRQALFYTQIEQKGLADYKRVDKKRVWIVKKPAPDPEP